MREIRIVHGAFMASPLIFLLVGSMVEVEQKTPEEQIRMMMGMLGVIYLIGLVMVQFLRRNLMRQSLAQGTDPIMAFKNAHLVTLAFYESGPIYGLLIALMGGPKSFLLATVGICWIMMLKDFPSQSRLR
ncbi:MAG: hypothetical protein KC910_07395 [Candidatus Eremiobacteraeota bacterium]|nr:hypothetical protein [Candidatus Eremiobacteraeota bacterium]